MLYKNLFFLPLIPPPHIYREPEKGESRRGSGDLKSRLDAVDRLLSISRTDRYCAWVTTRMQKRCNVPWARSNASAVKRGACSMSAVSTISMSFSRRRSWGRRPSYSWQGGARDDRCASQWDSRGGPVKIRYWKNLIVISMWNKNNKIRKQLTKQQKVKKKKRRG